MVIDERAIALDALERGVAACGDAAPHIAQYPSFRPLRGEPDQIGLQPLQQPGQVSLRVGPMDSEAGMRLAA